LPSDAVQFHPETDLLAYTLDRAAADRLAFAQTLRVQYPILVLLQVRWQSPQRLTLHLNLNSANALSMRLLRIEWELHPEL